MKTFLKCKVPALLWGILFLTFSCSSPSFEEENTNLKAEFARGNTAKFATHENNLNIVYFVPTDNPEVEDYKGRLSNLLIYFQDYIRSEMARNGFGEKTFGLPADLNGNQIKLVTIYGKQDQAAYDYGSAAAILNEIDAYKEEHPEDFSSQHTLILLPQRTDGGRQPFYGWGRNCFAVDNPNIKTEEIPVTSSNLIGGMLHELGHGLGLPHNKAKASEQQDLGTSLMGSGNYTFGRQPTFMTKADCAVLNRNQIFQPVSTPGIYEGASTAVHPRVSYDAAAETLHVQGSFTSDKAVSDVLFWLDPNVNNEGTGTNRDYNSVAWKGSIAGDGGFDITLPVQEVQDHGDWPYELKIKLVMENGTVNTHTYSFEFVNGGYTPDTMASVHQHSNYNGWGVELEVGSYTTSQLVALGGLDNDISSVKVPLGLKVTLYDSDNFMGQAYELTAGNVWFLSAFNDKASSIVVSEDQ